MPNDDADGFISDRTLQEFVNSSRAADVARQTMRDLPEHQRENLIRSWARADRLDELPDYYKWLIVKFQELRSARPLEEELYYALGEFVDIEGSSGAADAAHIYVLASAAWADLTAELKRQQLERDDEETFELVMEKLFQLGLDVGVYLQQQPISPYFEGVARRAHEFAFRAFQVGGYRPDPK